MSDFRVKVIAEIDWSKLETTCDKKITLTNVDFDKSAISKAFSNVKITFDSSSFSTLRSDIESKLKNIKLSFDTSALDKAITSAMTKSAKKSSQAADSKNNQSDYVKQTIEQLDKLESKYKGFYENFLNKSSNEKIGSLFGDQIEESLSKAQEQIDNLRKSLKDNPLAEAGTFDIPMTGLRSSLEEVNAAMESARKSVSSFYKGISDDQSGLLDRRIAEVKAAFEKMGAENNTEMNAEIGDTVARLDELRDSFKSALESGDTSAIVSSYRDLSSAITESTNSIKKFRAEQGGDWAGIDKVDSLFNKLNSLKNVDETQRSDLLNQLTSASIAGGMTRNDYNAISSSISNMSAGSGEVQSTWSKIGETVRRTATEFTAMYGTWQLFHKGIQVAREMFNNVKEIDSAMVELKKVTNETNGTYDSFLSTASEKAKAIGTTMHDYISSTADFARLGNTFEQAQNLAEVASKYLVVGDDLTGIDQATEHIISIQKAFNIKSEDALSIVDKLNQVGNTQAISSGDLGEALQRSASSFAAANVSFDKANALITASNLVVQDPARVGNGWKTVTMRLRGAKTELEEAGLETENMIESIPKLREELLALTGVDLMENATTFKDQYDFLSEVSDVWQDMTDIQQASFTELIAGKNQGNMISSLMQNFDVARDTLQESLNAEGSANAEHLRALDSIEAKINQFKASYESLSQNMLSSDFLKGLIDGGTSAISILDDLISNLGTIPTLLTAISGAIGFAKGDSILSSLFSPGNNILSKISQNGLGSVLKSGANTALTELLLPANGKSQITQFFEHCTKEAAKTGQSMSSVMSDAVNNKGFLNAFSSIGKSVVMSFGDGEQAVTNFGAAMVKATAKTLALRAGMALIASVSFAAISFAITGLINLFSDLIHKEEEARQAAEKLSEESRANFNSTESNKANYDKTLASFKEGAATKEELTESAYSLAESLGVEATALDNLIAKYGSVSEAMKRVIDQNYEQQQQSNLYNMQQGVSAHTKDLYDSISKGVKDGVVQFDWRASSLNEKIQSRLSDAGFDVAIKDQGNLGRVNLELPKITDNTNTDQVLNSYETLLNARQALIDGIGIDYSRDEVSGYLQEVSNQISKFENYDGWQEFSDTIKDLNDNAADTHLTDMLDSLSDIGIDVDTASFQEIRDGLIELATMGGSFDDMFIGDSSWLSSVFETRLASMEEFASRYSQYIEEINATTAEKLFSDVDLDLSKIFDESKVGDLTSFVDSYIEDIGTLKSALLELDDGSLSFGDIQKLYDQFPDLKQREEETGSLHKALRSLMDDLGSDAENKLDLYIELTGDEDAAEKLELIKSKLEEMNNYTSEMEVKLNIDDEKEKLESLYTALSEANSPTGLASSSIQAVKDRYSDLSGYDQSKLFENTANGMSLNRRELAKLEQQYQDYLKTTNNNQLDALIDDYAELTKQMEAAATAGDLKTYNSLDKQRSDMAGRINDLSMLASQFDGLTSKFNKWVQAQSVTESGDMYDQITSGISDLEELYNNGLVGTEKFRAGVGLMTNLDAESMSIDQLVSTYESGMAAQKKFFTEGQEGCQAFLDTVQQVQGDANWVTQDEEGNYKIDFGVGGDEEVANAISQLDGLSMSTEQVQAVLRKLKDYGFDVSIDTDYTQLKDVQTEAEKALKTLENLGMTDEIDIPFNFNSDDLGNIEKQIENAKSMLDQFRNQDGTVDMSLEGAEEAQAVLAALIAQRQTLEEPAIMKLNVETDVEEGYRTAVEQIQALQNGVNTVEIGLEIGNTDAVQSGIDQVRASLEALQGLSPELKAVLNIDDQAITDALAALEGENTVDVGVNVTTEGSPIDEIRSQLTSDKLTATVSVDTEGDINGTYNLDTSAAEAAIEGVKSSAENVEGTINFTPAGGVGSNNVLAMLGIDESIEIPVKARLTGGVDITTIQGETPTMNVNAKVSDVDTSAISASTPTITVNVALGDTSGPDSYEAPPKEGLVTFNKNSSIPDSYQPANKNATVFYSRSGPDTSGISDIVRTVTYNVRVNGSIPKATGTITGAAFPTGTFADSLPSNWKLRKNGVALMGELGPELIVNGNSMRMAGEDGAEFTPYHSGDIIFNASQTKELIKTGKIKGRGKLFGSGANYASGSIGEAFSNGSGSFKKPTVTSTTTTATTQTTQAASSTSSTTTTTTTQTTSTATTSAESATTEEEDLESVDWIEKVVDRIERAFKRLERVADSDYYDLPKRFAAAVEQIDALTQRFDVLQQAYDRYLQEADSIALSDELKALVRDGSIDVQKYDKDTKALIDDYSEWYEKALDISDQMDELKETLSEIYQMRFDLSKDQYDNNKALYEYLNDTYQNGLDYLDERGFFASDVYYNAMKDNLLLQKSSMEHSLSDMISYMSDAVNSGQIKEWSAEWYEMQQSINDVKLELQEVDTTIEEINNSMRELSWDKFDYLLDLIDDLNTEAEFFVELMSYGTLIDKETGSLTDTGLATMGMYGQQYNTYMAMADKYGAELKKILDDLKDDPYDQELIKRESELRKSQQQSILSAQKMRKAIGDLIQEGFEAEMDALDDLIDKYSDALDAQKDLYDYQRKLNDQTKEISSIQKQLAAYAGDDSEETQAKVQKLKDQLEEAEQDLQDTEFERSISEQKKMLDNLKLDLQTTIDERMDNIDALIDQQIADINANSSLIDDTLHAEADKVGYTMSDNMQAIWDASVNPVLSTYNNGFTNQLASILSVIQSIANFVQYSANKSDTIATKTTSTATKTTAAIAAPTTPAAEKKVEKPVKETPKEITVGSKINAAGAPIYASSTGAVGQWGTHQAFSADPIYVVTSVVGDYVLVRHHTQSANAGWFKKSDVNAFKRGGIVDYTGPAWVDGTKSNPEAVLNAADTKMLFALTDALRKSNLNDNVTTPTTTSVETANSYSTGDFVFNIDIDHVEDYNELVTKMRDDLEFENMIQDMTVNKLTGKGSNLAKYKRFR